MAILSQFSNILPPFEVSQEQSIDWLGNCHAFSAGQTQNNDTNRNTDFRRLFLRYGVKSGKISNRRAECPDISSATDWEQKEIYQIKTGQTSGVDIEHRNLFFNQRAREVLHQFYSDDIGKPEHLIHVTCTGYISPSAPQHLASEKKWLSTVGITHAYHMGCYASLPAIRIAIALSKDLDRVDLVHNEMCSLHMNPALHTPEQMVVQSLFGDGHIKYSVSKKLSSKTKQGLRVLAIREWVLPNSVQDMTWMPTASGMHMTLSREIPQKIIAHLQSCFMELTTGCGLDPEKVQEKAIFAIHPGGPKIIEAVEKCLELRADQTIHSNAILRARGNMSSATLPHIWQEILNSKPPPETRVVSFAFGPGLTIFGSLFEVTTA